MPLVEQIQQDITHAMKEREKERLDTLRMVKTALKNEEIAVGHALDDAAAIKVLQRLCKQRRESIEIFDQKNRRDLADKERGELAIIEAYLPKAPDEAAIRAAIEDAVKSTGATTAKEMGAVMKAVTAHFAGSTVDGKQLSQWVRERLSS